MRGVGFWITASLLACTSWSSVNAAEPGAPVVERSAPANAGAPQGTGVVKSIDASTGKVTISHDPIRAIGWPAMTMGFKVADPKLLQGLKTGTKVQFTLKSKDDSTVTDLRPMP